MSGDGNQTGFPLVDARSLPITALAADSDSVLSRSLRTVIRHLEDPVGRFSAFDNFASDDDSPAA